MMIPLARQPAGEDKGARAAINPALKPDRLAGHHISGDVIGHRHKMQDLSVQLRIGVTLDHGLQKNTHLRGVPALRHRHGSAINSKFERGERNVEVCKCRNGPPLRAARQKEKAHSTSMLRAFF